MNETIKVAAERIARSYDVGFDIGSVSADVAKDFIALKKFEIIFGYGFTLLLVLVFFVAIGFIFKGWRSSILLGREVFLTGVYKDLVNTEAYREYQKNFNKEVKKEFAKITGEENIS